MTYAQLAQLAAKQAQLAVNAQTLPYNDAIQQNQDLAASHDQAIQGITAALAQMFKGNGADISNIYGSSADAVAGYGKGFSDQNAALKADAGTAASTANPNLSPEQQAEIAKSYAGTPTDVMYGLHGYSPATSLRTLGAALGANFDKSEPGVLGGLGQEWLGANHADALKQLQDLQLKRGEVSAQYPSIYQSAFNALRDQQTKDQSLALTQRVTLGNYTGFDPVTGQPTYKTQHDANTAAAAARKVNTTMSGQYGVQMNANGEVIVGANGKPIAYPKKQASQPTVNTKLSQWYGVLVDSHGHAIRSPEGKFIPVPAQANTDNQLHGLKRAAYDKLAAQSLGLARVAHRPYTDKNGNVHPPVSWQEYLNGALNKKIPVWIVIQQGRRVYSQKEIQDALIPGQTGG
jgi:hypothetical protein